MGEPKISKNEPIPLSRGIEKWVGQGSLSLSLAGANFGGTLALLYEALRLSEVNGIQQIRYFLGKEWSLLDNLSRKFDRLGVPEWPSYPTHIEGMNSCASHSTLRLAKEASLTAVFEAPSVWSHRVLDEVKRFIDAETQRGAILFATKFSTNDRELGVFNAEKWARVLDRLSASYTVMVLGTVPDRQAFSGLDVVFLADFLTTAAQIELAARDTYPLIGDASGFFSAGIWHNRPYLCFKDPDYDASEMREEHDGVDQLKVASSNQLLIRGFPSDVVVDRFLQEAGYAL